ncbi:MAG: HD domain-containing protein [Candidatus Woesearchaeota archaeon]
MYKLKTVQRSTYVDDATIRRETTAEHVCSVLLLARYFLSRMHHTMNQQRIMLLLLYHDMVEVSSGDVSVFDTKHAEFKQDEQRHVDVVLRKVPSSLHDEVKDVLREWSEQKTMESRFCHALDKLDPLVQSLSCPHGWKTYKVTEAMLRDKKEHYVRDFPELLAFFNACIAYAYKQGFLVAR